MAKQSRNKKVKKSNRYKGSIRPVLGGDKKRAIDFESGKTINVTSEELEVIEKLKWGEEIKKEDN